ncbi:uncharacterized protein LOC124154057 [Ischnura elegans]|uniref:uncharacterized protein LOC124154057 n=1 Tax=Ischnura elegans TaxID=197161 RepID=UPI001ED899D8|nr:uncharacterized protein LOC124154057 [Ischnura elegans]
MSIEPEAPGFFHRLSKKYLCCCKIKTSKKVEVKVSVPSEEDSSENNHVSKRLTQERNPPNKNNSNVEREDCGKSLKNPSVVGKEAEFQGTEVCRDDDCPTQIMLTHGSSDKISTEDEGVKYGDVEPEVKSLKSCLPFLECPFVWKPDIAGAVLKNGQLIYGDNERNGSILVEYLTAKESEFHLVKNNFFRTLCINLVLAYEKALLGQLASSVNDIYKCQMLVTQVEGDSNSSEVLLVQDGRKDGIYFVLLASVAHIKFLQGSYSSSWSTVSGMKEFDSLGSTAKAMVHGLHAGVLMEYGYRGNRMAQVPIKAALALDPDCWLWSLYLGKILGRERRKTQFHMPAREEELHALQRAAKLNPGAESLSHLADVYKHLNSVITHQGYIPEVLSAQDVASLPQLARELYIQAASKEPNCPYNNARCAKGLMSLPVPFKDMDLAEKYMVRALHLAPNDSLVNHYAAYYYESRKEFEQAIDAYKKALAVSGGSFSGSHDGVGNYPAELGLLALQHRLETGQRLGAPPSGVQVGVGVGRYSIIRGVPVGIGCASHSSPLFQLDAMLAKYKSKAHRVQTLCNKGHYLLMYEKDLFGALRAFADAIRTDPKSVTLKRFWSVFGSNTVSQTSSSLNVFHLMKEEINRALSTPLSSGNQAYLEELLEFVCEDENTANS